MAGVGDDLAAHEGRSPVREPDQRGARPARWLERAKQHPVIGASGVLVAAVALIAAVVQVVEWTGDVVDKYDSLQNPHAEEYALFGDIDLDTRPEYFEDVLGIAQSAFDVCAEAPPLCADQTHGSLRLFVAESGNARVRALFDGDQLELYTVSVLTSDFTPPMVWLDHELGRVGEITYADATSRVPVDPTDTAIFMGPRSSAYVEVVAAGAPAQYRGLILANLPDARGDVEFDVASGRELAEPSAINASDSTALQRFRSASAPNTFGEFRDDGGYVSQLLRSGGADGLITLLFIGNRT